MPSLNKVMLMGHLTRDPQLKQLPSNTTVAEFGLAINRKFKTAAGEEREEVLFVDCSAFGRGAEVITQYCTKGKPLFVEGRMKLDTWEDKQGGGKRSKISVVVENFQFIGGRDPADASDDQTAGQKPYPRNRQTARGPAVTAPPISEEQEIDPEDIPF